jgi:hypothetical protein
VNPVATRLQARVEAVREHLVRRTVAAVLFWIVTVAMMCGVAAWFLGGGQGWAQGSDVPAMLDAALVLAVAALILVARSAARAAFAETPLAAVIERAADLPAGILRGALELTRETPRGVSDALARRGVAGAARGLEGRDDTALSGSAGEDVTRWLRRGRGAAVVATLLLLALTVLSPGRTRGAVTGLLSPIATAADPVLPPLAVVPGDVEVLRGSDVTLEVSAAGRASVELASQAAGDVARSTTLPVQEGRARYVFRTVTAAIEYRIEDAEGGSTGTYRIVPIDPLFVSDLVLSVRYPEHTGLPEDEYRGDPPPLRLPAGSRLSFEGRTSRPLSTVALVDSSGTDVLGFEVDGSTFRAGWTPRIDGVFEWDFRDVMGGQAEIQPEPLEVTVVPDRAPGVAIPVPGRDTIMPLNLRQPLVLEASDDYGLSRIELVAYRVTSFGERMEPVTQGFQVGGQRAIVARPLLDLSRWGLLPGDTIRYFARAVDNGPGAQVAVTPEYVLRLPEAAELRREAEDAFEGVADRLEELAAEAERQAEANRDQALEAEARGDRSEGTEAGESAEDFEEREELQRALEDQQQMSAEVDSLRAEMEAMERLLEEAGQADPELRRQLEELREMLQQMTGDDLQERMDDLQQALDQENLDQANQSLEEMAEQQEEFRKRLEEALERFERAALEQDFRATTTEAEELARQEQALADALVEEDQPEMRAQQQEELARQAESLEQRMEDLQERLADQGEQRASEGVQEARERAEQARQRMQEAAEQAQQGETQEAGQEAQDAAQEMQEAAQEMQEAMQQMAEQQMQAQQDALMRTADDALSLARRQSELRERMQSAGQEQLASMRAEEASMLQGVQNIAENLQLATEGAMGANRELSAQMGLAMESIQNTIEAMEGRRGSAPSPTAQAEQSVGDLNQLALMAIAGAEQMGQQGQGEGGEEVSEQLEQLAQQQGELMNQSTQLMPMQLGEQTMSQQLDQMQQGQESVASELGDLADEPGSEESLGDLEELAREAMAIAQELQQGRLTPETVQRQERLFHRLLDAGRSLEREEFSEERESEVPGDFERGQVLSLTAEQMGVMSYEIPDGEQLQRLSPAVRQLVLEYFERLNRARPGGGGS